MKSFVLALALALFALAPQTPTLRSDGQEFHVSFAAGQTWECVVFHSLTETIVQDGKTVPYEPRKCQGLDKAMTEAVEDWSFIKPNGGDWDVYAFVQTETPDGVPAEPVRTNTIRVPF